MSFLPIVERELRAAARRRSTFRVRFWSALLAMAVTFVTLLIATLGRSRNLGTPLFSILTFEAFSLALLAGVFLTAPCLTEEKRDGTLGLLFLTDLKGYDVVLGKFVAMSLNAFYGLLALLPMLSLPLLLGGVTASQFWRMALALANALFFSMAAGICVSALMREPARAMANTLGLVLLCAGAIPLFLVAMAKLGLSPAWTALEWVTPTTPFVYSAATLYGGHRALFWGSLAISNLAAWVLLAFASVVLPSSWQDIGLAKPGRKTMSWRGPRVKLPSRATLLSQNPVFWLRRNEIGSQWRAWGIVGLWAVLVGAVLLFGYDQNTPAFFGGYAVLPFGFLLKVLFALEACRFFAEGRKNGALELLLCTPLTDREIIHGQVFALWRSFLWPLAVFGVLLFVPVGLQVVSAMAHGELNAVFTTLSHSVITTVYAVRMCLDLLALCWFGMALGLTLKKPALASAWTLLIVLVLPSVLCWADILADLFLIAWGASKCQADLRRRFSEEYRETGRVPLQAGISAPPVLS